MTDVKDDDVLLRALHDRLKIPVENLKAIVKILHKMEIWAWESLIALDEAVLEAGGISKALSQQLRPYRTQVIAGSSHRKHVVDRHRTSGPITPGIPAVFDDVPTPIRDVIKRNANLAILAFAAETNADVDKVVEMAKTIPRTETRRVFEASGWKLGGPVFFGTTVFTSAFYVAEGKFSPKPYIVKLRPSPNERQATTRIHDLIAKSKYRVSATDVLLAHLVTTLPLSIHGKDVIVMPHYARALDNMPALPAEGVFCFLSPIHSLLLMLWDLDVYHCDIKPSNILLDAAGRAYLGDLGSIKFKAGSRTESTTSFMPTGIRSMSGKVLDAGMLLITCAQLFGWKDNDKRISGDSLKSRIALVTHPDMKRMLESLCSILQEGNEVGANEADEADSTATG